MEIILAITVATAVIFFSALISMGNERQRKAIDDLRNQTMLWAVQDLRIKHEKLARDVRIDNPIGWFNRIATKTCGYNFNLEIAESFTDPLILICTTGDGRTRVFFTPLSPDEIRSFKKEKRSHLSQYTDQNPLLLLPRNTKSYEISVLNSGMLFDIELPIAWKAVTGNQVDQMEHVWMYIVL